MGGREGEKRKRGKRKRRNRRKGEMVTREDVEKGREMGERKGM